MAQNQSELPRLPAALHGGTDNKSEDDSAKRKLDDAFHDESEAATISESSGSQPPTDTPPSARSSSTARGEGGAPANTINTPERIDKTAKPTVPGAGALHIGSPCYSPMYARQSATSRQSASADNVYGRSDGWR